MQSADNDWRHQAACRDTDPNTMTPERATPAAVAAAVAVCDGCPVLEQCRALAQEQLGTYGVWAGEWWGDPPRAERLQECDWCGKPMQVQEVGRPRLFCRKQCNDRANYARRKMRELSA